MTACHCRICRETSRPVTVVFYDENDRAYEMTADVSSNGGVDLWGGANDPTIEELARAVGRDVADIRSRFLEAEQDAALEAAQ